MAHAHENLFVADIQATGHQQSIHKYMLVVINEKLKFSSDEEKKAWTDEAFQWRLPYWDWALPENEGKVPDLFMPPSVNIRVPKAADGSQPDPENLPNPLYRFQLKVNGVPKNMGDLPQPYTVDNVVVGQGKDQLVLPVSSPPCPSS